MIISPSPLARRNYWLVSAPDVFPVSDVETFVTANDGNIYTFFYNDTGVHKASEYKMWYRKDWLENLGWSKAPSTPEEFKQPLSYQDRLRLAIDTALAERPADLDEFLNLMKRAITNSRS